MTFDGTFILAFDFVSPWMLLWGVAASAPLIIHLWNKRKYRETSWAAVEFLLAAMRKNARRIQLQQWLLLAVRTAIIALIVLAVAQPFWQRIGLSFVAGQRTHKLLVIDGSYSMAYRPTDESLFSRAKQLAARIVDESTQGDGFTLLLMSSRPRVIVGTPAFEPRDFLDEIDALVMPHAGGNLPDTMTRVGEILEHVERENPELEHHEVYFLSDLGRNTWVPGDQTAEAAASLQQQVEQLGRRASLVVLDLGQPASENLAITDLKTTDAFATIRREVLFEAQVRNFGKQSYGRQLVELLVDESRVEQQYVDLAPGGQATLSFAHRFETPGQHVVEVRLASDFLGIDNHRWISVQVKENLRVLCVSGKQGSTHYLTRALDPDPTEFSLIRPDVVSESALVEMDLAKFDCIFLCNVAQFTGSEARLLENYLKQGGGLVFFLGDRVMADRYNHELTGEAGGARILPVRLGKVVSETSYGFDPLDYRHPLVSPFRGQEQAGLLTTRVSKYFRLEPIAQSAAQVALGFIGGDPAIVEEEMYDGRSIVVATAGSLSSVDAVTKTPWTTMPAWHSYVPIVRNLLATAVGSQSDRYNTQVDETLGGAVSVRAANVSLSVRAPGGNRRPVRISAGGGQPRWAFDETHTSGIYIAAFDAPLSMSVPYAVNVNTAESDLRKSDPGELPSGFNVQTDWQDLDERPSSQIGRRTGLHYYLLCSAFVLLLFESFLAWWFGRGLG